MLRTFLLALLDLAAPALASEKPYVTAADLDLTAFLPMPVKAGSPEDKRQQEVGATTERIEKVPSRLPTPASRYATLAAGVESHLVARAEPSWVQRVKGTKSTTPGYVRKPR
jgi:hypothetical protein